MSDHETSNLSGSETYNAHQSRAKALLAEFATLVDDVLVDPLAHRRMWVFGSRVLDLAADMSAPAGTEPRTVIGLSARQIEGCPITDFYAGIPDITFMPATEPDPELPLIELAVGGANRLEIGKSYIDLRPDEVYCLGVLMVFAGRRPRTRDIKSFGFRKRGSPATTNQALRTAMNGLNDAVGLLTDFAVTDLVITDGTATGKWYMLNPNVVLTRRSVEVAPTQDVSRTAKRGTIAAIKSQESSVDRQMRDNAALLPLPDVVSWLRQVRPDIHTTEAEVAKIASDDPMIMPLEGMYSHYARQRILKVLVVMNTELG